MAEVLLFNIPAPGANEEAAVKVHWYQSVDGQTWGAETDNILVADLPVDVATSKYRWNSVLADPLKYHLLKTEGASGLIGVVGAVIPPRASDPGVCQLLADLKTMELVPQAGIEFNVTLKPAVQAVGGVILDSSMRQEVTNAAGRVVFDLAKGGKYEVTSPALPIAIQVDTTGKSYINLADLLV